MVKLQRLTKEYSCLIAHNDIRLNHYTFNDLVKSYDRQPVDGFSDVLSKWTDAQILLTNTFDANRFRLKTLGLDVKTHQINYCSARQLKNKIKMQERLIALGGCIGAIGMEISYAEAMNGYAEQAQALAEGGCELLWLESFNSLADVDAALEGCLRVAPQLPIVVTIAFRPTVKSKEQSPEKMARELAQRPVFAFGADSGHGDPHLQKTILQMAGHAPFLALKGDITVLSNKNESADSAHLVRKYTFDAQQAGVKIIALGHRSTIDHIETMLHTVKNFIGR